MQIRKCPFIVVLVLSAIACFEVDTAYASQGEKRSRSDKNIDAIGHRNIAGDKKENWYSIAQENEIG